MNRSFIKYAPVVLFSCLAISAIAQNLAQEPTERNETPWKERAWEQRAFNSSYEDNSTFKHKETFFFDPFIWAYSKEFADKFRMPKEWIDPDLKGAMAVAWRMTTIGQTTCGLGGRAENCAAIDLSDGHLL